MKNTNLTRAAASLLACGMVFGLTACSSSVLQRSNRRERSFQRSCQ